MDRYEIRCTEKQTKKALELGAPIKLESEYYHLTGNDFKLDKPIPCKSYTNGYCYAICPTAEQMIGWLRGKGLSVEVICKRYFGNRNKTWMGALWKIPSITKTDFVYESNDYIEATLAAIDAALEHLSKAKEM